MKLILIYGPPAVGKLTVAQALSQLTGFKVLHNHLIVDLALSVFDRGTIIAADCNHRLRCLMYEEAARNGLPGLISTVLYRYDIKDQIHQAVRDYGEIMRKHGGELCVVRLFSDIEILKKRVANHSRIGTKKISSVEKLTEVLEKEDLMRELPESIIKSFSIDNSDLEPEKVADMIRSRFNL